MMTRQKKLKGWWCHDPMTIEEYGNPWPCCKIKKCEARDSLDSTIGDIGLNFNARNCGYGYKKKTLERESQ
jgi:hypothetical protein